MYPARADSHSTRTPSMHVLPPPFSEGAADPSLYPPLLDPRQRRPSVLAGMGSLR